jgi:hypothetical protein
LSSGQGLLFGLPLREHVWGCEYTRRRSEKSGSLADDSGVAVFHHWGVYFPDPLQHGNPEVLLGIAVLLVGLVQGQSAPTSDISRHPYARASDGGELASDLPAESIGRAEMEPLLWSRRRRGRRPRRR